METKSLSNIFDELVEKENKIREKRHYFNTLFQEVNKSEAKLNELSDNLKSIRQKIESNTAILPNLITKNLINVNEIKIISKQFTDFSLKKENLVQKNDRINDDLKKRIDIFVERCLSFSVQFGHKGLSNQQSIELRKRIDLLKKKRLELRSEKEKMQNNIEYYQSADKERNSLLSAISYLEEKKNKLKNEIIVLKSNENELINEKKALENMPNNGLEFKKLKQELEDKSSRKREYTKCSELYNFDTNNQSCKTPTQYVLQTVEQKYGVNENNDNNSIEMKDEEKSNKYADKEKRWEKRRKRRINLLNQQLKRQE